jgi:hypothetical protein
MDTLWRAMQLMATLHERHQRPNRLEESLWRVCSVEQMTSRESCSKQNEEQEG